MTNEHSDITQLLYGNQRVKDTLSRFLSKQNGIDLCSDSKTTAQVLEMYKNVSSDPNNEKEIRMRFLTDINTENILFCKELMKISGEVRHLTGIKTNFAVRGREYIGIATLKKEAQQQEAEERLAHSQSYVIYSIVKSIIEQQQYLFNNLWEKSIPAEHRIKELEEGCRELSGCNWICCLF